MAKIHVGGLEPGSLVGGSRIGRVPAPAAPAPTQEEQYEAVLREVNAMDKDVYKRWLKVPGNVDLLGAARNWNVARQAVQAAQGAKKS